MSARTHTLTLTEEHIRVDPARPIDEAQVAQCAMISTPFIITPGAARMESIGCYRVLIKMEISVRQRQGRGCVV